MRRSRASGLTNLAQFAFAISAIFAFSGCRDERQQAATDLMDAFSSGCSSVGDWTQTALGQTRALETILENLKASDSCAGAETALASVQNISDVMSRLAANPNLVAEKQAEEEKRQLLLLLSQTTDPTLAEILTTQLATAEVNLASARAASSTSSATSSGENLVSGLTQLTGYLSTLMSSSSGLETCLRDHPAFGVQLGASALAIAGTFVTPPVGAAISGAGQILSGVIDFARRESLGKYIRQVQSIEMDAALACGLESMANTYCDAQDVYRLAKIQADNYLSQGNPTPFWKGLDLWSNRVPVLMSWIGKVAGGVSPSDTTSAGRQNEAWSQVHELQADLRNVEGLISETDRLLGTPQDVSASANWQELIVRSAIKKLLDAMHGAEGTYSSSAHPISDYYSTRTALLYRIVLDSKPPQDSSQWLNEDSIELPPQGFTEIVENVQTVFTEIGEQLLSQLHLVVDVDPAGLLREALQPETIGGPSPMEVIQDLITFLNESAFYFGQHRSIENDRVISLIEETRSTLTEVLTLLLTTPARDSSDRQTIALIFERLNLLYGTEFISGRIYRHIQWDLNARAAAGEIPHDVDEILRLSGRDAAKELLGVGQNSLDELVQDIGAAQAVSQHNVESFIDIFQGGIAQSLSRLSKAADRAGEAETGPLRPNRMLQARLCTLVLTTSSDWPKKIPRSLCEGVTLESVYPTLSEIRLNFNDLETGLAGRPLAEKMCTYRNFLRRGRLLAKKPLQN